MDDDSVPALGVLFALVAGDSTARDGLNEGQESQVSQSQDIPPRQCINDSDSVQPTVAQSHRAVSPSDSFSPAAETTTELTATPSRSACVDTAAQQQQQRNTDNHNSEANSDDSETTSTGHHQRDSFQTPLRPQRTRSLGLTLEHKRSNGSSIYTFRSDSAAHPATAHCTVADSVVARAAQQPNHHHRDHTINQEDSDIGSPSHTHTNAIESKRGPPSRSAFRSFSLEMTVTPTPSTPGRYSQSSNPPTHQCPHLRGTHPNTTVQHHLASVSLRLPEVPAGMPLSALSNEMAAFHQKIMLTNRQKQERKSLLERLESVLNNIWKRTSFEVFGSSASGFNTAFSDLDLNIVCWPSSSSSIPSSSPTASPQPNSSSSSSSSASDHHHHGATGNVNSVPPPHFSASDVLNTFHRGLINAGFNNIRPILSARVPVLKIVDHVSGVHCDVVYLQRQNCNVCTARLLFDYAQCDPRVSAMVAAIKFWSRQRDISDSSRGFPNSFALTLMVLQLLQLKGVVPNFQDKEQRAAFKHRQKSKSTQPPSSSSTPAPPSTHEECSSDRNLHAHTHKEDTDSSCASCIPASSASSASSSSASSTVSCASCGGEDCGSNLTKDAESEPLTVPSTRSCSPNPNISFDSHSDSPLANGDTFSTNSGLTDPCDSFDGAHEDSPSTSATKRNNHHRSFSLPDNNSDETDSSSASSQLHPRTDGGDGSCEGGCPKVPSADNDSGVGVLLQEFFSMYCTEGSFKPTTMVVSVRHGHPVDRSHPSMTSLCNPTDGTTFYGSTYSPVTFTPVLCVEDPFDASNNVARNVRVESLSRLQEECSRAFKLISSGAAFATICAKAVLSSSDPHSTSSSPVSIISEDSIGSPVRIHSPVTFSQKSSWYKSSSPRTYSSHQNSHSPRNLSYSQTNYTSSNSNNNNNNYQRGGAPLSRSVSCYSQASPTQSQTASPLLGDSSRYRNNNNMSNGLSNNNGNKPYYRNQTSGGGGSNGFRFYQKSGFYSPQEHHPSQYKSSPMDSSPFSKPFYPNNMCASPSSSSPIVSNINVSPAWTPFVAADLHPASYAGNALKKNRFSQRSIPPLSLPPQPSVGSIDSRSKLHFRTNHPRSTGSQLPPGSAFTKGFSSSSINSNQLNAADLGNSPTSAVLPTTVPLSASDPQPAPTQSNNNDSNDSAHSSSSAASRSSSSASASTNADATNNPPNEPTAVKKTVSSGSTHSQSGTSTPFNVKAKSFFPRPARPPLTSNDTSAHQSKGPGVQEQTSSQTAE